MKTFSVAVILAGLVSVGFAQDHKDIPKPGREHQLIKQEFEGDWDAVSRHTHDGKMEESQGTETVREGFNGFWYVIDFKGDMNGKPFAGHGLMGYDPMKKKYLLTWVDSMAPFAMWAEGEADAQGKTFTFSTEGYCPDLGKTAKIRLVMDVKDSNHRTLTFYRPNKEGTEEKAGQIFYTRKTS